MPMRHHRQYIKTNVIAYRPQYTRFDILNVPSMRNNFMPLLFLLLFVILPAKIHSASREDRHAIANYNPVHHEESVKKIALENIFNLVSTFDFSEKERQHLLNEIIIP